MDFNTNLQIATMELTIASSLINNILEANYNVEEEDYNITDQNEVNASEFNIMLLCVDESTLLKHFKLSR